MFEFGSGFSTLYYSKKVKSVTSVESDKGWFDKIEKSMPQNVSLTYKAPEDVTGYSEYARTSGKKFDLIIVDGLNRFECAENSIAALKEGGIIILDNSNRMEYKKIYDMLKANNFRWIDFWGVAPGSIKINCTTIFYKSSNCLSI